MIPLKAMTKTADTMASVVAMAGRAEDCTMPAAKLKRSLQSNSSAVRSVLGSETLCVAGSKHEIHTPCNATSNAVSKRWRQCPSTEAMQNFRRVPCGSVACGGCGKAELEAQADAANHEGSGGGRQQFQEAPPATLLDVLPTNVRRLGRPTAQCSVVLCLTGLRPASCLTAADYAPRMPTCHWRACCSM